jgi:S1-C subfamily serine protease
MKGIITPALLLLSGFGGSQIAAQSSAAAATDLYKKAAPAVVLIELYNDNGEVSKTGSGFLVSADGKIVTNYHLIGHSKRGTVRLTNKDAYDHVQVLDIDKQKDMALIQDQGC